MAREMKLKDQPLVVVVSPLKSLIADQIRECERFGLSSCKIEAGNIDSLKKECNFDVLFVSAEVFESFAAKSLLQFFSSAKQEEVTSIASSFPKAHISALLGSYTTKPL